MEKVVHTWLKSLVVYFHPKTHTELLDHAAEQILNTLVRLGHAVQEQPDANTDVILTTHQFGDVLGWRKSLMFTSRIKFKLAHTPRTITLTQISPADFDEMISHFTAALSRTPQRRSDFEFEGLASTAPEVLIEQGKRGGPILSLIRLIQAQLKCIRVLLLVGEERPKRVYHFDLVGAHPFTEAEIGEKKFYEDIVYRMTTYESTFEVTKHQVVDPKIPAEQWQNLSTVAAMKQAGIEMGKRSFFTDMLRINDLVPVPVLNDALADQYSEGCFATWEPEISALIATVTGSARPVDKGNITSNDLAAIIDVAPDKKGALVRQVQDSENISPSSEAVELIQMDAALPKINLGEEWPSPGEVPVVRSKLHGHRGVSSFNPELIEYVPMDEPFFHYLVSCATEAQAIGIKAAFGRTECLLNPDDPRLVAFTVLPGHGVLIVEKWVSGKEPFQLIWELMDQKYLVIDNLVPQGPLTYKPNPVGQMVLVEEGKK
jgi:hypothetical protein